MLLEEPSGPEFSDNQLRILRRSCLDSHLSFTRYFFKKREGSKFITNTHHRLLAAVLDKVLRLELKRLIINIPPGYTKTEMAVINFIAHGLALNPQSKFIHTSYADSLALQNSTMTMDVVNSEEYQQLWPMSPRKDSKSKKAWYNEHGGGMLAVASGGTITGFRAGRMVDGFSGAFIIDDPIKPEDAYSDTQRMKMNRRFPNTFKSRLAHEDIPIIVIMQRVHEDDPTGFLLKGGTGEMWHHLVIPVDVPEKEEKYPQEYTHGIPIPHNLEPGPLWPYKHTEEHISAMKKSDPYTYASQYDQRPSPLGGGMFKDEYWKQYEVLPPDIMMIRIYGDTAQKTKEHNDYSVFQAWGLSPSMGVFLLDQVRGKWEAPELERKLVDFWNKWKPTQFKPLGAQVVKIEDKSSGSSLIQAIRAQHMIPVEDIQRNTDKIVRAFGAVKYFASGYVHIPANEDWIHDYKEEFRKFTPLMTHSHDDQIDPTMDAVEDLLIFMDTQYTAGALA